MALPYLRAQLSHKTIKTPRTQPLAFGSVKINWSIMPSWLLSIRHCCKCSCCLFFSTCLGLLHFTYAKKSQTRIFSLHDHLVRLSKDSLPVADYLHQLLSLSTTTSLLLELQSPTMNWWWRFWAVLVHFRDISSAIWARDSIISDDELFAKLIYYELFLKHEEVKKENSVITAAMVTHNKSIKSNNCAALRPKNTSQLRSSNCTTSPAQGRSISNHVC